MVKRPMLCIAAVLILGIGISGMGMPVGVGVGVCAAITVFLLILTGTCHRRVSRLESRILICCLPGVLLCGMVRFDLSLSRFEDQVKAASSLTEVTGTVLGIEEKNGNQVVTIEGADGRMLLYFATQIPEEYLGSDLRVSGKIMTYDRATNEGQFDSYLYHRNRGEVGMMSSPTIQGVYIQNNPWTIVKRLLYRLRISLMEVYINSLPGEESALMGAIALGNRSGLDQETKNLFQMAGIIHLLSVSSTHIGCVSKSLYRFLRKRGVSYPVTGIISGIVAILYGTMCGNSISAVRAVGMFLIFSLGNALGEAYDNLSAVNFMAVVQLLYRPMILYDTGFLFSYGAVLGVILVASPLQKSYEAYCKKKWESTHRVYPGHTYLPSVPEYIKGKMISAIGIQLATLPMVARFFYEVPTYVCFLNLIILPIFPILLIWGLVMGIVNLILPLPWLLYPCHQILYSMEAAADYSLKLPYARVITGAPGLLEMVLYYVVLLLLIRFMKENYRYGFLLGMVLASSIFFLPRMNGFRVDVLDVGQGNGIYGQLSDGTNFFSDGGSSDVKQVGTYRILPYLKYCGIRHVDYWMLSHMDSDHTSGFLEVLELGYDIQNVVVAEGVVQDEAWEEIKASIEVRGIRILYVEPGDEIISESGVISFLYPESENGMTDRNAASLVFQIETMDRNDEISRILFPGDIGADGEVEMVKKNRLEDVDILIAAHHGSNYSNSKIFLEEISPELVIYSAGEGNSYGHPGLETRGRVSELGITEYCTIWGGRVRVKKDKEKIEVSYFRDN